MVHIMLTRCFRRATDLTFISIPGADAFADLVPLGSVVVGVVGPGSGFAQTRHGLFGKREPVAGGLQIGGRQVERFLPEGFVGVPAAFEETGDLCGDLEFAPGFG